MAFHTTLATLSLLGPGRSILVDGARGWLQGVPTMYSLVGLGLILSYGTSWLAVLWPARGWACFFDEPVMITGLMLLGKTLETLAQGRARQALEVLMALQPTTACLLPSPQSGEGWTVPAAAVLPGQWVQVLPGEKIPVDGVVVVGRTRVDESLLTGEALPIPKAEGDAVQAGTLNQAGRVVIQTTQAGEATSLGQIVSWVTTAQLQQIPVQRLADQVAAVFAWGVVALALLTFGFWAGLAPRLGWVLPAAPTLLAVQLAIAVLVVACPCALGLATPTAVLVGLTVGARRGLLFRNGAVLERLRGVTTVVFDKTGTLTAGRPQVMATWLPDPPHPAVPTPDTLLALAAACEQGTCHPLAQAIADAVTAPLLPATAHETTAGRGVTAWVAGHRVRVGALDWLGLADWADQEPMTTWDQAGQTTLAVEVDGRPAGLVAVTDPLRPEAMAVIRTLEQQGLRVRVLSGDRPAAVEALAATLGLSTEAVQGGVLPVEKAAVLAQFQAQGERVVMVGDGLNDGPALTQADVGMAMASGTDLAVESAQIVLTRNHLADVVTALALGRATVRTIRWNLGWALAYNLLGLPAAAGVLWPLTGGFLTPGMAAGLMTLSSLSVVLNALGLYRWQTAPRDAAGVPPQPGLTAQTPVPGPS